MDLISSSYGSNDSPNVSKSSPSLNAFQMVSIAPEIDSTLMKDRYIPTETRELYYNPTYQELYRPAPTAKAPWNDKAIAVGQKNILTGYIEDAHINDAVFNNEQQTFESFQYATNPSSTAIIGNPENELKRKNRNKGRRKRKRGENYVRSAHKDPSNIDLFRGSWYNEHEEKVKAFEQSNLEVEEPIGPMPKPSDDELNDDEDNDIVDIEIIEDDESIETIEDEPKETKTDDDEPTDIGGIVDITDETEVGDDELPHKKPKLLFEPSSTMHVPLERDFQGHTWVDPPSDLKKDKLHQCFAPKKKIHTWSGHSKSVSTIKFLPGYGNLLLSASMDNTVKIWEVYGRRRCMQTYVAHSKGVRDISFQNDGHRFASCGYDKFLRLWDTETGACLAQYQGQKIPFCIKFNPGEQHYFLSGHRDKRILQWDIRTGEVCLSYDRHLGAVNSITFEEDGSKFISTSDDKSIRVWEFGIPVEIKYITDPSMYSISSTCLTKNEKWLLCQSSDNKITVYNTQDRYRLNRKKKFTGHLTAGSTCDINTSPDGRFVLSGSTTGDMYIWDWRSTTLIKKQQAHEDVMTGAIWHPIEPSKVATCGWDGSIKYWD